MHVSAEAGSKENEPAAAEATPEAAAPSTDADMTEADPEKPAADEAAAADGPSKTNYQMSVKTDEKSAAVNDSQAGDASTHQKSTEVKAAAQVEEGTAEGNSPGVVGKLDVHLTYLWQVHRVNFYVGGGLQAKITSNRRSLCILVGSQVCSTDSVIFILLIQALYTSEVCTIDCAVTSPTCSLQQSEAFSGTVCVAVNVCWSVCLSQVSEICVHA